MESFLMTFIANYPYKKPRYIAIDVLQRYKEIKASFKSGFRNSGK